MVVPKELVALLRCPCASHAELDYKDRRHLLLCTECEAQFPVRDNVPVMLLEEASPPRGKEQITTGDGTVIRAK